MSFYPDGHFIKEFAGRTVQNIEAMRLGKEIKWQDTALMSFLLGVFLLPHERAGEDKYMVELLKAYSKPIDSVVKTLRTLRGPASGEEDNPPSSMVELPRYLRHAIAHFNIRPESQDEQNITHLLIWNRLPKHRGENGGKITFVARINIDELRCLANYVLKQLAGAGTMADRYEGTDPISEFDEQWNGAASD